MDQDPRSYLSSLELFGIKLGLENMSHLVEALGHPERAFKSIHIAGTNGKGSVAAIVDQALRRQGYRCGRYTSPHLIDLTERFVVDGEPVTESALGDAVSDVRDVVTALRTRRILEVQPTFFEVTTAAAFELFRRARVDLAVCEVGLGGRLDSTNVLTPVITAITSIDLDHQNHLGSTLAEIAREKAGIIKPAVPVVVAPLMPEAFEVIDSTARERGAELIRAQEGVTIERRGETTDGQTFRLETPDHVYGDVSLGLEGDHQLTNATVAVRLLERLPKAGVEVSPSAIVSGLSSVQWPGRLQRIRLEQGRELLLDAAHNPAGARALARFLAAEGASRPLVFAAMRDKDVEGMLAALLPTVGQCIVLTRAPGARSADPAGLAAIVSRLDPRMGIAIDDIPASAVARAFRFSARITVAGSIFLLGEVLRGLRRS